MIVETTLIKILRLGQTSNLSYTVISKDFAQSLSVVLRIYYSGIGDHVIEVTVVL